MKKHWVRFVVGTLCVLVALGHAAGFWRIPFVSMLDAYLYDVRIRLTMPDTVDTSVIIVDIDEKSLDEVGRWPWNRNVVAELVRRLVDDYRAAVVGFDVVFAEPDRSSGLEALEAAGRGAMRDEPAFQNLLGYWRKDLDYDRNFAKVLHNRPVVLGYYFSNSEMRTGALPTPVFSSATLAGQGLPLVGWSGYGGNLPQLLEATGKAGHINPLVDFDGVFRRVPLVVEYAGEYYDALSLAVVREWLGNGRVQPGIPDPAAGIEWLDIVGERGALRVPVDRHIAALVPYRGYEHSFPYVAAVDVLKGRISKDFLAGKVILVGTTAPGLMDLRSTPVGAVYPGVEVHANLIAGMLNGEVKEKPGYVLAIQVLQMLLFGGLLALALPLLSPVRATLMTFGVLAVIALVDLWVWSEAGLVLPLAAELLLVVVLFAYNMSWGYFVESHSKRRFAELFGQYVPPELVDEMARNPEEYSMEGRSEELTVLFADIRGFTTISEGMSARDLAHMMNVYLDAMTAVIRRERGTLDKYIGDAIMAFWGAPVAEPAHARHAVLAALAMQRGVQELKPRLAAQGWPELTIGIGINTGQMVVGDMGSSLRKAYTVIGDAVNLASRLEGITKTYGVGIVVGQATKDQAADIVFRELDRVRVKGKDEPVAIYEPIGLSNEISGDRLVLIEQWHDALRFYREREWNKAEQQIYNLLQCQPDCRLYALYAERIAALRENPPDEPWDGVTSYQTK